MTDLDIDHDLITETEAMLTSPDTWIEAHPHGVTDEGQIGGDVQAGPAWSRRFIRYVSATGLWAVIDTSFYVCACDHDADDRTVDQDGDERCRFCGPVSWIANQTTLTLCSDFRDPGGTELSSDVTYDDAIGDFGWQITTAYARQRASAVRAEYFGDPATW